MTFTPAPDGSVAAFVAIVIAVVVAFIWAVRRAYGRDRSTTAILISSAAYLLLLSAIVALDVLERLPLNGLPFFFGAVLIVSVAAGLSSLGTRLAAAVPLTALVAFQAFRLPLELVLHAWVEHGTIPATMTWTGQNWDIVSGVAAVAAAPFARRSAVAWTANLVGAILLANVVRVAVLSSPLPIGWHVSPPLLLALHLPYALIGPVCVGGALFGHIVLTRKLLGRSSTTRVAP
jgi:hypothetical protein